MWEVYWTAGYTVDGSSDVIVDKYCKRQEQAEAKANGAAHRDVLRLVELGVAGTVTIWAQQWRSRRVEETFERVVVNEIRTTRRREARELRGDSVEVTK